MRSTTGSRRVAAAVVGLTMLGVATVGTPSASAVTGDRVCDPSGRTLVDGGRYVVQNDRLATDGTQCVTAEDGGFALDAVGPDVPLDGPPKGYPSIFIGQYRGGASTFGIVPRQVDEVGEDRTTVTADDAPGAWSAGHHLWFSSTRAPSGDGDGTEIVIWTYLGPDEPTPVGVPSGALTVEEQDCTVWVGEGAGSDVITFVRDDRAPRAGDVPIRPFLDESLRRGLTEPGSWLTSVQLGFEVRQGGQGLRARSFSHLTRRNPDADPPGPPRTSPGTSRTPTSSTSTSCARSTSACWGDLLRATGARSTGYRLDDRSLRVEDVDVALNATPEAGNVRVTRAYAAGLRRGPSSGELAYWRGRDAENYVNVGVLISGTDEYAAGLRTARLGILDRGCFGRCGA